VSAAASMKSASRRYLWRSLVLMLAFTALLVGFDAEALGAGGGLSLWGLVGLTVLPLFLFAYELVTYIRSMDEMMSRMQIRAGAIAALIVLLVGALVGIADLYGVMDAFNMALLLPLAAIVHGMAAFWQEYRVQ